MNFIDRYKQELTEKMDMDNMNDEQMEAFKQALAQAMMSQPKTQEVMRRELREEMTSLADIYCDVADIFFTRMKGKLTNSKTVELINRFYDTITEVIS